MIDFVVLTDFSTAADKALHYTTLLARQVPSSIHLLHFWQQSVLDPDYSVAEPVFSSYFDHETVSTRDGQEQALQKRIEEFGRQVAIAPHFIPGTLADQLPAFLKQLSNPLVMVGKCDTGNLPDEMLENISVKLLSLTRSAFLIVPESHPQLTPPKRIAIALHEKEIKHRNDVLQELTSALHPEIQVIHVSPHPAETIKERLTQQAGTALGLAEPEIQVIQRNSIIKGIKKYCKENKEDLLVLVHRKHAFLLDFFNLSVIGNFIRHTPIPILVLPG